MHFNLYIIHSKQTKILSTNDNQGNVQVKRIEWGIGKGKWKRQVRQAAEGLGLRGHIRPIYFLIGSYYKGEYDGDAVSTESFYSAI